MPAHGNDAILASLERLHSRLDRIESRLAPLEATLAHAPGAVAMFTDTVDQLAARAGEGELDARMQTAVRLLDRATRPDALAALEAVLARVDRLGPALALLDHAPGALSMAVDTFDDLAARVAETGIPLHERVHVLLGAAERLTSPAALEVLKVVTTRLNELHALLESGVLDPEAVRVVSLAGRALVASKACECGPVGPVGAARALTEPEVKRALGFAVAFARQFGTALDTPVLESK